MNESFFKKNLLLIIAFSILIMFLFNLNILITLYPSDRSNYSLPESFMVNPASEYIIQEQEIQEENTFLRESYAGLLFYSCWNITDRDLYIKCNDTRRYYYFLEEFDESTQAYRINLNSLSLPEFTPEILYLNLKTKELTKISFEEARNFVNSDFGAYFDHSYGAQKVYEEGVGKDYFSHEFTIYDSIGNSYPEYFTYPAEKVFLIGGVYE